MDLDVWSLEVEVFVLPILVGDSDITNTCADLTEQMSGSQWNIKHRISMGLHHHTLQRISSRPMTVHVIVEIYVSHS